MGAWQLVPGIARTWYHCYVSARPGLGPRHA